MKWLENLSNAIEYIESNLDKDISIDAAAQIACCSTYYFQRVFTYVAGISLSEYIRRRRMSQAAFELQKSDKKVLDIALKYGYSSPTAFNRAFQSVHGITPVAAKNMGSVLNAYPPIRFSVKITGGTAMSYRITEKAAMRIVGIRIPLVADMEENQKVVPEFWKKALENNYLPKIIELANQEPGGILGVTVYENPQEIFYFIAASTTEAFPKICLNMKYLRLHGLSLKTTDVLRKMFKMFSNVSIQNGFRFRDMNMPGLPDLEVYPVMPGKPLNGHSEVWIGIKKEKKED